MSKACVPNPLSAGLMKSWCRAGLGWRRKSGVSARVIAISRRWPLTRRPGTLSRTESREIEAVSLGIQPTKFSLVAAVCLLMIAPAGCVGIQANRARLRNAVEDRWERLDATRGLDVSPATAAVLGRQGLILQAQRDQAGTVRLLESRLQTQTEPDGALALAELSYHVGVACQTRSPASALGWYRDAATLAAIALAEPACSHGELAIAIHNRAVARLIRLAQRRHTHDGENRNWQQILEANGLLIAGSSQYLAPDRIGDLQVSDDFRVEGMDHIYVSSGLGVPLIAHRFGGKDVGRRPGPVLPTRDAHRGHGRRDAGRRAQRGAWRDTPANIKLLDPFQQRSVAIGGRSVVLASDRTTPLAMQVARGHLAALEWAGLFDSSFEQPGTEAGLYMLRPYEPRKIPVVFVHGLFSSPRAWIQTINELQNNPSIAARYQFWMFIYPTGQPIPGSAAVTPGPRRGARHARPGLRRHCIRPDGPGGTQHGRPSLKDDGPGFGIHPLGRNHQRFARQVQGIAWDTRVSRQGSHVPPRALRESGHLHRNPSSRQPDRRQPVRPGDRRPGTPARPHGRSHRRYRGPQWARCDLTRIRGRTVNAITNLRTDSEILAALDRIPIRPAVRYHSIIPLIGGTADTDGVVEYRSSHLEGAESERVVAGTHVSQQEPAVTRELDRILREHLAATDGNFTANERVVR